MTSQKNKATDEVALNAAAYKTYFKSNIKQLIVKLACYGLIPSTFATWLIRVGGLRHD